MIFIEEHDSPVSPPERVSGEWISSALWPGSTSEAVLTLGSPRTAAASASVGVATGNWCPPPPDGGLFADQRIDEARSACFESEPLAGPVAVLGVPRVRFTIAHPGPRAIVSVKLNDVAPGGESQPVTRGAVNVACDGEAAVQLDLMATGWRFRPGHRIRVAVAANDWPCLWPLPRLEPVNVTTRGRAGAAGPARGRRAVRAGDRCGARDVDGGGGGQPAVAVGDRPRRGDG